MATNSKRTRPKTDRKKTARKKRRRSEPAQSAQLTFGDARKPDGKHGGWRPGAGRPATGLTTVPHRERDELKARNPNLVTWRLGPSLPSLREQRYADIILAAIAAAHTTTFRITDYSIQTNHLHFIAEADAAELLGDGMQRLAGRLVHRLNRAMDRGGQLFDERYHARFLETPREVKNALRYVINNARHHGEQRRVFYHPDWIDPFSSAAWFDGWRHPLDARDVEHRGRCVTAEPHTWLRRVGWRRWGLLEFDEIPGGEES